MACTTRRVLALQAAFADLASGLMKVDQWLEDRALCAFPSPHCHWMFFTLLAFVIFLRRLRGPVFSALIVRGAALARPYGHACVVILLRLWPVFPAAGAGRVAVFSTIVLPFV